MRYRATSLGDIAQQFRRKSQEEYTKAERTTGTAKKVLEAQAATWNAAAILLDNTVIIPPEPEKEPTP